MPNRRRMLTFALITVVLPIVVLALLSITARQPKNLGVTNGRLAACPSSPNCVCSQADDAAHRINPIPFDGSLDQTLARCKSAIAMLPRTSIVAEQPNYLRAECRSRLFRFVDDLELFIDPEAKLVHVRSASRSGHGDLGVNRQRVEEIRRALNEVRHSATH